MFASQLLQTELMFKNGKSGVHEYMGSLFMVFPVPFGVVYTTQGTPCGRVGQEELQQGLRRRVPSRPERS